MSTDFFRRYLDLLNEAETTGRLIANRPVIPGQPLSSVQMATVDFARSMGNQIAPEVQQAYDLAKQAGITPGPEDRDQSNSTKKSSVATSGSGQPPADFTPTHFHKNNLGFKIPLMQTPDGSFWWMTTDSENPRAGKTIQSWVGNTENRSSLSGTASVDGVFKDGKAIEFPEGMSWKEYAASAEKSPQAALPAAKSKQIEPELLAPLEPTDSGRKLVAPNTNVALPSSGTFSNDQALANLAAQMKDSKGAASSLATPTGSKTDSLESLELLKQVRAVAAKINALSPLSVVKDEFFRSEVGAADIAKLHAHLDSRLALGRQLGDLISKAADIRQSGGDMSDVTARQIVEISESTFNKEKEQIDAFLASLDKIGGEEKAVSGSAASGSTSGAASGSGSGAQWAFVPGDGTSRDISGKKDSSGLPSAAEIGAGAAASKKSSKEIIITDLSHCEQCGTPKSIHAPLKHQFVPGDDVRPGPVGGSAPSSDRSVKSASDTAVTPTIKVPSFTPGGAVKRGGVSTTPPTTSPRSRPPLPINEDINRLPVADQMRAWQQLMEAPSGLTAAQAQAQRAGLGRPGSVGVGKKPDVRSLADKLKDIDRQRFDGTSSIDHTPVGSTSSPAGSTSSTTSTAAQTPRRDYDRRGPRPPPPPPELPGWAQSRIQGRPTGTAASAQPMAARGIPGMDAPAPAAPLPPAAPANWKTLVKNGLRKLAAPAAAAYSVYEGWNKINALPKDKMSRAQYAAEVTKIVTKLVEENGIVLVSTWLGGLAGGAITGGAGAIPGMIGGAGIGMAAEYYYGDNISEVVNGVVDSLYGTGNAPAPQENKLTPKQIADYKAYVENAERWLAERTTWSPADQAADPWTREDQAKLDQFKSLLKAAGVTVAPAPQAAERVPAANSNTQYKETFDKANVIVDKIKNLDPKVLNPNDPAFDPQAIYNLRGEIIGLFANEIGIEGQKDPAVAKQMDSIYELSKAAADAKYTEAEGRQPPATSGPKEGQTGTVPGNPPKKVIFKNGKWVPQ
jgi:hypothetical protein